MGFVRPPNVATRSLTGTRLRVGGAYCERLTVVGLKLPGCVVTLSGEVKGITGVDGFGCGLRCCLLAKGVSRFGFPTGFGSDGSRFRSGDVETMLGLALGRFALSILALGFGSGIGVVWFDGSGSGRVGRCCSVEGELPFSL